MRKFVGLWGLGNESEIKGKTILDAGCGTGEKAVYFAKLGAKVTAIDINKKQLSHARKLARRQKVDVDFRCADVLKLNLKRKFDLVLCSGVLHHTPDPQLGFANIAKHLKPDGRILLGLYNKYSRLHYRLMRWALHNAYKKNPKRIMRFVNNFPIEFPLRGNASQQTLYDRYAIPHESYHTLEEVRRMFKENGIEVMDISPGTILNSDLLSQLAWLTKGKSFFFVSGRMPK
jgi:SAM-dependent methyltransferase